MLLFFGNYLQILCGFMVRRKPVYFIFPLFPRGNNNIIILTQQAKG